MAEQNSSTLQKVSRVISDFFNPLVALVIYFIYDSSKNLNMAEAWEKFWPLLLIVILPIIIWIIWNVKTGRYTNMDVSDRKQRKSLYVFIEICLFAYLLFEYFYSNIIDLIMIFILVLLLLMQLSNFFIKSSMHTSFNVFVAALFFALNWKLGLVWLGIAILVGITRVILKRHTVQEVLMGSFIAVIVSFAYLYANIQLTQ